MSSYKELEAWKRAMSLAKEVYALSALFPGHEQFGLTSQVRRAAVSIPSNIALGSLAEVETQLLLAKEFKYFEKSAVFVQLEETKRSLLGLINYIKNKGKI